MDHLVYFPRDKKAPRWTARRDGRIAFQLGCLQAKPSGHALRSAVELCRSARQRRAATLFNKATSCCSCGAAPQTEGIAVSECIPLRRHRDRSSAQARNLSAHQERTTARYSPAWSAVVAVGESCMCSMEW